MRKRAPDVTGSAQKDQHLNIKTAQGIIRRKLNQWIASIEDESLRKETAANVWVTGGAIASLLTDTKVNDFDVYFKSQDVCAKVAAYYVLAFSKNPPQRFSGQGGHVVIKLDTKTPSRVKIAVKSAGIAGEQPVEEGYQYFELAPAPEAAGQYLDEVLQTPSIVTELEDQDPGEVPANPAVQELAAAHDQNQEAPAVKGAGAKAKNQYRPVYLSQNAITLSDGIQLCVRFCGSIEELHKNFDFIHCTNYYDHATGKITVNSAALESLLTRELRYCGSLYPVCSIIRTRKFIKRGWRCNAGQFFKMAYQVSKLNLDDLRVLEDQLTGVDTAYFHELIRVVEDDKKSGKTIDQTYIMELVDRLF